MAGETDSFDWMKWATDNPGLVGAFLGMAGTALDPQGNTTTTSQQQVSLPDYLAPYAGRVLNKAEAISNEGYIPYSGARVADFTADQQQAFDNYRNMDAMSPMQTQGGGIVGAAADKLMGGGGTWDQAAAQQYMSPYQQSVIDIGKREAQRQYDMQVPVMDAAAARGGAFGGDRHAIVQAEAYRNLTQQMNDMQTQGMNTAYNNGQQQFNADQNRQMTGAASAVGAGNTLAGIGQQGFQNQLAVNQGIMGIGNQQQALNQTGLNVGYQNFVDQRDDPLKKLGIMQSGYNGMPMTQTATANTTPAPSFTSQLIGNGIAGYTLGQSGTKP